MDRYVEAMNWLRSSSAVLRGTPLRSKKLGRIDATQDGKALTVQSDLADKEAKAGGLSWSAGEIQRSAFTQGRPITIRYSLEAEGPVLLQGQTYAVEY
jgi:hypothetical protein